MATAAKPKRKLIKPRKRMSATKKSQMKRSFTKWDRSAAGRKYDRIKKNPSLYKNYLRAKIAKLTLAIKKLRAKKGDPDAPRKIKNNQTHILNMRDQIRALNAAK